MAGIEENKQKLSALYNLLIGEPKPEEEEDAQKELVQIFSDLVSGIEDSSHKEQAQVLLTKVQKWDTLEKWFKEVNGLKELMADFLESLGINVESPDKITEGDLNSAENMEFDDSLKQKVLEMEAKLKALEEKERLLEEKEKKLMALEKQQTENQEESKPAPSLHLKSKLMVPKVEIPRVTSPKKKIAPSTQPDAQPEEQTQSDLDEHQGLPQIKINLGQTNPIKIKPTPIKIVPNGGDNNSKPIIKPISGSGAPSIQPISADQIKPVSAPGASKIAMKPVSMPKPVGAPSIKPVGNPSIKPVSAPSIKPVGASSIKPIGGISAPSIQPVGRVAPSIKPVSSTPKPIGGNASFGIKPVGSGAPMIKPVGGISKPNIRPVGQNQNSVPNIPRPQTGPVNLFDQSPGQKRPVNLFDPAPRGAPTPAQTNTGRQSGPVDGPIEKIGGLNKINFAAEQSKVRSEENSYFASLPPFQMYQELIQFEAKRFYFDNAQKQLEKDFDAGKLDEGSFRGGKERYKFEIDRVSDKIKEIRALILGI